MYSSKVKAFAVVFALMIVTCLVATGCKGNASGFVNTGNMPGNTFKQSNANSKHKTAPNIVYLGSNDDNAGVHFGDKGVTLDLIR